mmetsp:Transcript_115993/g.333108  ORF Transcript_115993/g.333108 Transcript_115993/m.333108 type:complete len:246 (-) Transcript_115993:144-881(-)
MSAVNVDNGILACHILLIHIDPRVRPARNVLDNLPFRALHPAHVLLLDVEGQLCADRTAVHVAAGLVRDLQELGNDESIRLALRLFVPVHVHCGMPLILRRLVDVDNGTASRLDLTDHGALPAFQPAHTHGRDDDSIPLSQRLGALAISQQRSLSAAAVAAMAAAAMVAVVIPIPRRTRPTAAVAAAVAAAAVAAWLRALSGLRRLAGQRIRQKRRQLVLRVRVVARGRGKQGADGGKQIGVGGA